MRLCLWWCCKLELLSARFGVLRASQQLLSAGQQLLSAGKQLLSAGQQLFCTGKQLFRARIKLWFIMQLIVWWRWGKRLMDTCSGASACTGAFVRACMSKNK